MSQRDFRKKHDYITGGKYFLAELERSDLEPKSSKKNALAASGLSRVDRQELQIKRAKDNDVAQHVETAALKKAMDDCV